MTEKQLVDAGMDIHVMWNTGEEETFFIKRKGVKIPTGRRTVITKTSDMGKLLIQKHVGHIGQMPHSGLASIGRSRRFFKITSVEN